MIASTGAELSTGAATNEPRPPTARPRKRWWWVAGVTACALAIGGAGMVAVTAAAPPPSAQAADLDVATEEVQKGTLSGTRTIPGVLDYRQNREQSSSVAGVLTAVPPAGSTVNQGESLFSVDNVAVFLFTGAVPTWRPFEPDMTNGPDVLQLEQNLRALGFFDREPDTDFTWDTQRAIRKWQEKTGQETTGRIDLGRVVFSPEPLRVADVTALLGDHVGPGTPILRVSDLTQEVTANLKLADQRLAVLDAKVEVQLPGGQTTSGTITQVGQPTETDSGDQKTVAIPITITLDDPAAAAGIQRANVTIDVPSETKENVLFVPLDALIAMGDGKFGLEVVSKGRELQQVPVTTGLFAGGSVEVTGPGISEGTEVVVPGK